MMDDVLADRVNWRGALFSMRLIACVILIAGIHPVPAEASTARPSAAQRDFDAVIDKAKKAMMADPLTALPLTIEAEALAKKLDSIQKIETGRATALWLRGEALDRTNHPDEALLILITALKSSTPISLDRKLEADITLAKGTSEAALSMTQRSLEDFQKAYSLYVITHDARGQAKALLSIGGIYSDAGDYSRSFAYYKQIPDLYSGDPSIDLAVHNNLGETLRKLQRYKEAEAEYRIALLAASKIDSPLLSVRILTNIASAQYARGALQEAEVTAKRGEAISMHGEAAGWRPFLLGVRAQIALKRNDLPTAQRFIEETFFGTEGSSLPYIDFHDAAYRIYQRQGNFREALNHLLAYKRLDDEEKRLTSSGNSALMAARFDFANQNLRIEKLRSEKVLQSALMAESKANFHMVLFCLLGGVAVLMVGGLLVGFFSIRRSRNEVRAANADLHIANASLEKALRVKTEFLATTSHEIRTPLNGILGMTQVILADRKIEPTLRERIEIVHGAGQTMRALVDDILDVAKIETGNLTVDRSTVNLRKLLEDSTNLWRSQSASKGLILETDFENCPEAIEEDEAKLRQIVFNLMSNAIKFTDNGTVRLQADTVALAQGEQLVLRFTDSGIGIAQDQQEIIFESFRQADGATTRRFGGTGLGLSICRSFAAALGGSLVVESRPNEGSTFTLALPLRRAQLSHLPEETPPAEIRPLGLAGASILLIEANPLAQRILSRLLQPVARLLILASNIEAGAARLSDGSAVHHLVIEAASVIQDGPDKWRALKTVIEAAHQTGRRSTILFSPSDLIIQSDLMALGATQVLAKPIGGSALIEALSGLYEAGSDSSPLPLTVAALGG